MMEPPSVGATETEFAWPQAAYKGLNYYGADDHPLFVGRDDDILLCARSLGDHGTRLMLLHGLPACGKSSFLRAGLIPYLEDAGGFQFLREADPPVSRALFVRSTDAPLQQLARAIYEFASRGLQLRTPRGPCPIDLTPVRMGHTDLEAFCDDVGGNTDRMRGALAAIGARLPRTLVLVIDQGEEVLTLRPSHAGERYRSDFFEFLANLSQTDLDLRVMVALRTEYYGRFRHELQTHVAEPTHVRDFYLANLDRNRLIEAIKRPTLDQPIGVFGAPHAHYRFSYELGLPERIAADLEAAGLQGGILPAMQIVCERLYERTRRFGTWQITSADYEQLGGVEGQMRAHLNETLREAIRRVAPQLITTHEWRGERDCWKRVLSTLVKWQVDGSVTTELRREDEMIAAAREARCQASFELMMKELCTDELRVCRRVEVLRRDFSDGNSKPADGDARLIPCYCLGHDTVGLVLKQWDEAREQLKPRSPPRRAEGIVHPASGMATPIRGEGVVAIRNTTGDAYHQSLDVITTIRSAWETGHTLVPLLGAGISVDSGMPLVDSIMEYLVMIRKYVELRAYRPQYAAKPYARVDKLYREHPIRYIRHYGWPDPFQLRHELMLQYTKIQQATAATFDQWISQELDDLVSHLKRWQKTKYQQLVGDIGRYAPDYKAPSTWKILGDWRAVIRDFTEFTPDDADSLFERLYRWHKPGRSHHFWAFLTRLMGLRLFLTTNFDNFLERALAEQGVDHRVFGVEHGDNLPHESLVRETVSIIKLHGDTHRLLLDERLDYPPGQVYLGRLQACMPKQPIMVAMGCGGNDPRTLEVVKDHCRRNRYARGIPSVIWLHFEPGNAPRALQDELGERIQHARVTNPGLFLSHLYAHLRGQHPASRVPYDTHLSQPIAPLGNASPEDLAPLHRNDKRNVFIYESRIDSSGETIAGSQLMADFVYKKKTEGAYMPIWINLDAHHSVAGVVQQIVERCRVHDTFVSPFDTRLDDSNREQAIELITERLFHILRRGRYVLAFNALDAFLSPPTMHHGSSGAKEDIPEIERLFSMLEKLMADRELQGEIDVIVCASFQPPRGRRSEGEQDAINACLSGLVTSIGGKWTAARRDDVGDHGDPDGDLEYDSRFVVSCFRRPRSLVSLRSVFEDVFADTPDDANARIRGLIEAGTLLPTEGGFFRMQRDERDRIYERYSRGASAEDVQTIVRARGGDRLMASLQRCYDLASTHGLIARCYYTDSYLHSLDPWIFFEYFYHRTASLRYITRLVVLLNIAEQSGRSHEVLEVVIPPTVSIKNVKGKKRWPLQEIDSYVVRERNALVQSLKHALVQAQAHLLDGMPAAQIEAWCRGVLRDSFLFSVGSRDHVPDPARCPLHRAYYGDQRPDDDAFIQGVKDIFGTMLGLLRTSVYEQARVDEAAKLALSQLGHRAGQPGADVLSFDTGKLDAGRILAWLRDHVAVDLTAQDECVQSLLDALAGRSGQINEIQKVRKHYDAFAPSTLLGQQNQLRAMCLLAERRIVNVSDQRFDSCLQRSLSPQERTDRDEQLALIDEGVALCRVLSPERAMDSSHDPYYLRFRARLLLAKVRLESLYIGNPDSACEVDCLVEGARASMSADDHARFSRLEMTWAESLLLLASVKLSSDCPGHAAREQALAAARVAYVRAGDALQRAREHLGRSSRNVERWASFQRLWAQYQVEWCLFHLAYLEQQLRGFAADGQYEGMRALADLTPRDMAALLKRLKRGLNGVQAGLVLQPDGTADRWLWRIWLELLCAGMIYGVTTAAGAFCYEHLLAGASEPEASEPWPLGIKTFWDHWRSLNKRAGIPVTVELGSDYFRYLKEEVGETSPAPANWRANLVATLRVPSDQVSTLRDKALELAEKLYRSQDSAAFAVTLTEGITELADARSRSRSRSGRPSA